MWIGQKKQKERRERTGSLKRPEIESVWEKGELASLLQTPCGCSRPELRDTRGVCKLASREEAGAGETLMS